MSALTLERLRLLLAVANIGTIAGAAEQVGYTPSAVSQQLSALETQLGASLLERSNRGVTLTPTGIRLRARAAAILDLVETATVEATQVGPQAAPIPLRIGSFPTAISSLVVPAMASLEPLVRLTIVHLEPEQALSQLTARRLDAALLDSYDTIPELTRPELYRVNLMADPLRVVVRADRGVPGSLSELSELPWILGNTQSRLGRAARIALTAADLTPNVLVETDDQWLTFDVMSTLDVATVLPELALRAAPEHVLPVPHIDLGSERNVDLVIRATLRPHPGFSLLESALLEMTR